jgi:heme/copper-type cytochrome/quinol oxidase subunit 4
MLVRRNKMKTTTTFVIVILLAVGIAYIAFAADESSAMMSKTEGKHMMGKGMMGCPIHMMMCEHMMKKEIISTGDGGVIVMACNKLYKYDKDLNLVKEVELKIDQEMKEKMEKMQKECMEKCQMMKQGEKK